MSKEGEKRPLLENEKKINDDYSSGSARQEQQPQQPGSSSAVACNPLVSFVRRNKSKVPGYGMWRLLRHGGLYPLVVLTVLLAVYLLNQLDRYTLPIVTTSMGPDLRYGDKTCQSNPHFNDSYPHYNGSCADFTSETDCRRNSTIDPEYYNLYTNDSSCRWWWSGEGLVYQILAGPVFNNLYPLAGLFTGFLADFGNRKVFLGVSLVFWSLATGLTGFAQKFWHLVILRALLAIGAAGCNPFAVSILGDYFPKELRGSALGIYYFGIYIGYSLAFAIGNGIDQVLGWRWVFFLSGIAGIVVAPVLFLVVREPTRTVTKDAAAKDTTGGKEGNLTFCQRLVLLLVTYIMPGMLLLCIAGGIRNAGGYVWAYNTEIFFQKFYSRNTINKFMSWIPLVGGSLGAIVGGVISDILVKGRGTLARIWVLVVSQLAAAPFAAGALFLPYPWCFLSLIPSNIIGEMWIGATSAIIVDLSPTKIRTASLALYFFIVTVIGGNFNLLVEPIKQGFAHHFDSTMSLRLALLFTFPALYVIGALLFLLSYFLMQIDFRLKPSAETYVLETMATSFSRQKQRENSPEDDVKEA